MSEKYDKVLIIRKYFVLTIVSIELLGRDDDLDAGSVVSVGNRVVKEADCADDSVGRLEHLIICIRRIANNQRCRRYVITTLYTIYFPIRVKSYFFCVLVQHVGSAMDCAQSGECFGKSTESVYWVEEGTVAISPLRINIQLHFPNRVSSGLI